MKCKFCAEEINDEAVKCKFCGSVLNQDAYERATSPVGYRISGAIGAAVGVYFLIEEVRTHNNSINPTLIGLMNGNRSIGGPSYQWYENMYYLRLIAWSAITAVGLYQLFKKDSRRTKNKKIENVPEVADPIQKTGDPSKKIGLLSVKAQNSEASARPEEFKGERTLENDLYKIYLTEKYHVKKNELFNKFVWNGSMHEDIEELLKKLHELELDLSKKTTAPVESPSSMGSQSQTQGFQSITDKISAENPTAPSQTKNFDTTAPAKDIKPQPKPNYTSATWHKKSTKAPYYSAAIGCSLLAAALYTISSKEQNEIRQEQQEKPSSLDTANTQSPQVSEEEIKFTGQVEIFNEEGWSVVWRVSQQTGDVYGYYFPTQSTIGKNVLSLCRPHKDCDFFIRYKPVGKESIREFVLSGSPEISGYFMLTRVVFATEKTKDLL